MLEPDTLTVDQDDRQARAELQGWLDEVDSNMGALEARVQAAADMAEVDMDDLQQRRDEIRTDLQNIGVDPGAWTATSSDEIQGRLRDLDSDIEEARLNSYEQRDEFIAEVRTRLQEIDSEIAAIARRSDTPDTMTPSPADRPETGVDQPEPGMIDDPVEEPATGRRDGAYGTLYTDTSQDVDVEELRSDREEIGELLTEAETEAESEFDSSRESLAESVAELHARVQEAGFELRTQYSALTMPTSPSTASVN